uniref:Putative chaperone n=1 Tax=viral metagenome TaxID=1070528 RepID=A0A6M3XYT7_9ZZZZ
MDKSVEQLVIKLLDQTRDDCPKCKGDGQVFNSEIWGGKFPCSPCDGTGKDPNSLWHPELLAVLAKDQRLPKNPYHPSAGSKDFEERFASEIGYGESQQDMRAANFKKIKSEEKYQSILKEVGE